MKFRKSVKAHLPRNTSRMSEQEAIRSAESEAQRAPNEKSRVTEVTKTETSKVNHGVVNVTRSKTSKSQQESSAAKFYRGQVVTTSEQSAVESHTSAFHADSSCQAAGLEQQSDQSTCEIQPSMSRGQSASESKQWPARRTRFQQSRRRTWTTISFRSCVDDSEHRPEIRQDRWLM